jgi:hypothetical protein
LGLPLAALVVLIKVMAIRGKICSGALGRMIRPDPGWYQPLFLEKAGHIILSRATVAADRVAASPFVVQKAMILNLG